MDPWTIGIVVALVIVITGIVKGWGENRSIIIFKDFDDLGLTFLVPAAGVLIVLLFSWLGGNQMVAMLCGSVVSAGLFVLMVRNTYIINSCSIPKTLLAVATKMPLALIWVFNMIQLLNPGGKTAQARRQSRGQALVILAIITPIIGALVVERSGTYFNPASWLRGRRVGSGIRDSLR